MIETFLPKEEGISVNIMRAMNYSIHVGGKRLRPMLMEETYRMFGGKDDDIIHPFMAAIEMIHTYSLCHDDLPAMDNDMYRRGKKSTHAEFGEAMGILAGDALLNYAFETAFGAFDAVKGRSEKEAADLMLRISEALRILAKKAGIYGMIGGQVADVESEKKPAGSVSMDTIGYIHENKTAAMIESSMMIGAVLAGAGEDAVNIVESVGKDVGIAFQIKDDILDVTGTTEVLGKSVGSDEKNGKATYVSLAGLEKAQEDVKKYTDHALNGLSGIDAEDEEAADFLKELITFLIVRNS